MDNDTTMNWNKASVVTLVHPHTGQPQHFIVSSNNDIYEVQGISRSYGSFFVGSRVLSNGTLHVMTRIDPLFFLLHQLHTTKEAHQWQPMDQLQVSNIVQHAIKDIRQWNHVCAVKKLGDDLILYKIDPQKALQWLVQKQEAAYKVVRQQMTIAKRNQQQATQKLVAQGGGAFSSSFRLAQDEQQDKDTSTVIETNTTTSNSDLTPTELIAAKQASVDIVCEYLSTEWQTKLRSHLQVPVETTTTTTNSNHKKRPWQANPGQNDANDLLQFTMGTAVTLQDTNDSNKNNKMEPAQTAGFKRLAKVNTKGMKSLSSFFGAKKKTKTT